ncbi:trifunctional dihydropteroate synthetase [Salix suchowensis]|nr:trifunctional dihydropteroate synthetase [Salix suchowensis]
MLAGPSPVSHAAIPTNNGSRSDSSTSTLLENLRQVTDSGNHVVALAIGSNIGDSCRNIEYALRLLEDPSSHLQSGETGAPDVPARLVVTDTSFMYQSAPMRRHHRHRGYSTKPGAAFVSPEEETSRVVPAVQQIRGHPHASVREVLISVDTFRPEVAKAAVSADSYPLSLPDENMTRMIEVAKDLTVPVVLMHSREMREEQGLRRIQLCGRERGACVGRGDGRTRRESRISDQARHSAVVRDCGSRIGFSKTVEGNLELLRNAGRVVSDAEIGSGNRSWGNIIAREHGRNTAPKERGWATAAAVACAVQQKSLVVRVHDTREMGDVVQISGRYGLDVRLILEVNGSQITKGRETSAGDVSHLASSALSLLPWCFLNMSVAASLQKLANFRVHNTRASQETLNEGSVILKSSGAGKLGDDGTFSRQLRCRLTHIDCRLAWAFLEQLALAAIDVGRLDVADVRT